ncbi:MAG: DUF4115 domain-containing protein [Endozoicomonas sp. (ex Botrylloides leachii)]|nr:DUF4115 domain-containing protein [Endozoicomonas sp. (ex Botrylloides leachii)]
MNTEHEDSQELLDALPETPWRILAKARKAKGLSVNNIACQLKITETYVLALEQGNYDKLPGITFVRGYIKNYARLLGLQSDILLQMLDADNQVSRTRRPFLESTEKSLLERYSSPLLRYSFTLLVAVAIAFGSHHVWHQKKNNPFLVGTEQQLDSLTAVEPDLGSVLTDELAVSPSILKDATAQEIQSATIDNLLSNDNDKILDTLGVAAAPPKMVNLEIRFADNCWIEVRDMQGNILLSGIEQSGTVLNKKVPSTVLLRFGNAPSIDEIKFAGRIITIPESKKVKKVAQLTLSTSKQG